MLEVTDMDEELMSPSEVAMEMIEDLEVQMPHILERVRSPQDFDNTTLAQTELEGRIMYEIQDAKISTYSMHMELQNVDFPLNNASDISDPDKFQNLLSWLDEYYPTI